MHHEVGLLGPAFTIAKVTDTATSLDLRGDYVTLLDLGVACEKFEGPVTLVQFLKLATILWSYLTSISGRLVILRGLFGMPDGNNRNFALLR